MAQRSAHPVVPIALLVFGLVAILLLTVPTEDVREAPGFMNQCVELSDDSDFESPIPQRRRVSQRDVLHTTQGEHSERQGGAEDITLPDDGMELQGQQRANGATIHFADFIPIDVEEDKAIEEAIKRSLLDESVQSLQDSRLPKTLSKEEIAGILKAHSERVVTTAHRPIYISRGNVWTTALRQFNKRRFAESTDVLYVTFASDENTNEDAEDLGGPRREFFRLLVKAIFRESGAFEESPNGFIPRMNISHVQSGVYRTIGQMISTIIVQGGESPALLSPVVVDYLMTGCTFQVNVTLNDVADIELREALKKVDQAATKEELEQAVECCDSWRYQIEGLPNPVSMDNKAAFVKNSMLFYVIIQRQSCYDQLFEGLKHYEYGVVLDAGSSHTALYIYKWLADKQNGTGVVTQHAECHVKGGGISSYAGQPGSAGQSLEACLNQAVKDIPKERHQSTPVYLGATAGMRLLHMSSQEQSDQILQEVGNKIQSYPFSYRGAAILSGQEEGAYGWVTVNYLLENFIKYGFVGHWLSPGRPTVGALDFGGASTQITFATQDEVEDEQDLMKLHLYGQEYSLYTHSFLCYGRDQVLKRLLAHIVTSQGGSESVTHPCYPADHSTSVKLDTIFNSPCTAKHRPSSYDPQATLTVQGSGHYGHCLGNMSEIFSFDGCPFSQCSFDSVFQPNVTGSFVAFSAFFYTHSFLQQITGIPVRTPSQLEEAAGTVCSMTFTEMLGLAPDQKSRLQDYCAISVFMKILMLRGYSFDETSFPRISFQKKAGDTSVGWALGYMLSLSNLLPAETAGHRKALTPGAWGTLIFLFVLLLAAVLVFVLLRMRDGKKKGGGESTI